MSSSHSTRKSKDFAMDIAIVFQINDNRTWLSQIEMVKTADFLAIGLMDQ